MIGAIIIIGLLAGGTAPPLTDIFYGNQITAESPFLLQKIEHFGEQIQLKNRQERLQERMTELSTANTIKGVSNGIKNVDALADISVSEELSRRHQALLSAKSNVLNERAREAIDLAIIAPYVKGNLESLREINKTKEEVENILKQHSNGGLSRLSIDDKIQAKLAQ